MDIKVETELSSKYNIGDVITFRLYDYYSIGIVEDIDIKFNQVDNTYAFMYYVLDIDAIEDPINSNNIQKVYEHNVCCGKSLDTFDKLREMYLRRKEQEKKWEKEYEEKKQAFTNYNNSNNNSDRMR